MGNDLHVREEISKLLNIWGIFLISLENFWIRRYVSCPVSWLYWYRLLFSNIATY
jgi:hypothetical protein